MLIDCLHFIMETRFSQVGEDKGLADYQGRVLTEKENFVTKSSVGDRE